ncbi:uncharacterized protein LOC127987197 [Carassius gibelio]|uniref:uncharacterized protein LOC127987197 n=1 Tax=Carassius gibelio TaxID=101364 RepID=UPI0022784DB1|nr:uncharacterized protein LOC127987197 [Carassius gibelio]
MENLLICLSILWFYGTSGAGDDVSVSVNEGDLVTLYTDVKTNQQEEVAWYFNNIRIARITGDLSKICTDVECNEGTERFRDRLKLDHQTGSLTIMNTRTTDSGEYKLVIISSGSEKIFRVAVNDVPAAQRDEMKTKSVVEGEPVTLHPGVTKTPNVVMTWYFNDSVIAEITRDQSNVCTDVQCKERFRDRLKLDHQTGSLTIMNINTADTGVYQLKIFSSSSFREKSFSVTVLDSPDKVKTISAKKGESVTFDPGVIKITNYVMTWYFNDSLIAEITGDQSKICEDDECKERFRDRLKLNQTGSLTIMNTRNTDAGEYKVLIINHILQNSVSVTSLKIFIFTVIDSGLSSAAVAGICVGVVVVLFVTAAAAVAVIYYLKRPRAGQNNPAAQPSDQMGNLSDSSPNPSDPMLMDNANVTSPDEIESEAASEISL